MFSKSKMVKVIKIDQKTNILCTCLSTYLLFFRVILDGIIRSASDILQEFLNLLEERQTARAMSKNNLQVMYTEVPTVHKPLFRRLVSDGMNPIVEDKLLYMKENLIKISKHRAMKMVCVHIDST